MKFLLVALLGILMLCNACAPVYIPNSRQVHLLDHRGELDGNFNAGTNGTDIQGAYAVSDHLGIMAAGSFDKANVKESNSDYHKHHYGELGLEYFTSMGKIGRFELGAGMGRGSATAVDHYDFISPRELKATGKYNKLFISSDVGLQTGMLDLGVVARLGNVSFTEFETSSTTYTNTKSATFFEPAALMRLGWKHIKLESQIGFSKPFKKDLAFDYEPFYFSLGLNFNFSTL